MSFLDKAFWYDWDGANEFIFKLINSLQGDVYDVLMLLLSRIADHHNFPYYMAILVVFVLVTLIVRWMQARGGIKQTFIIWFGIFLVLSAGYVVQGVAIQQLKENYSYSRPYVTLHNDIRQLEQRASEDDNRSFPSGHAAFITLMVVGMWPILSGVAAWIGVVLIFGVMWSRIALGVHYPADVVGGFFLSLFIVLFLRAIIYWLLHRLFGLRA